LSWEGAVDAVLWVFNYFSGSGLSENSLVERLCPWLQKEKERGIFRQKEWVAIWDIRIGFKLFASFF
jgi:hypothetical protein